MKRAWGKEKRRFDSDFDYKLVEIQCPLSVLSKLVATCICFRRTKIKAEEEKTEIETAKCAMRKWKLFAVVLTIDFNFRADKFDLRGSLTSTVIVLITNGKWWIKIDLRHERPLKQIVRRTILWIFSFSIQNQIKSILIFCLLESELKTI